mgnify:CR=1 FL=1
MQNAALGGGFSTAPQQSARAFRAAMNAMARPGTIETVEGAAPPAPLSVAAGVLALTVLDAQTPVFLAGELDCKPVRDWITFHTGAPFAGREFCAFAFGTWRDLLPLEGYRIAHLNTRIAAPHWWWNCPHWRPLGSLCEGRGFSKNRL